MKRTTPYLLAACLLLSAPDGGVCEDAAAVKIYTLRSASSETLTDVLDALVKPDGKVVRDRASGRLIVVATPEQHRMVEEVLRQLDVPTPNIRIDLTIEEAGRSADSEAGLGGSGTVVVTPWDRSYDVRINPRLKHQTTTGSYSVRQQLLLQSGTEARLFVGQDVPFSEWLVQYCRHGGYIEQRTVIERVGASLSVSARLLGDGSNIVIRLLPEVSTLVGGRKQRIALTQAATEVTAKDGVPVKIGGFGKNRELYNRYLVGIAHAGATRDMRIILVPTVERTAADAAP